MTGKKLTTYRAKRDFSGTPEPTGGKKGKGNSFVVQKHNASHLHYDFRLEVDGVLKSWAVPKGISKTMNEKRLAVQTEDHPLDYGKFEGIIPEGHYGAGTVEIWDAGTYETISHTPSKNPIRDSIKAGRVKVKLHGKKLKGTYALVLMHKPDEKNKNWLLFRVAPDNANIATKDE
ncbi:MAG TPA: DNA polymerase ligase N-terminal domain-containing protein [Gammaproteobacteria bacterium]|nr:DNA polymerase ligase N-terminal domain-containing protein [Gammaproteobacteria bacterium]